MHGRCCNRSFCSQAWCCRRRLWLLPRAVARIVAIVAWLGVLFLTVFVPVSPEPGSLRLHIAADPLAQAFFGSTPLLDYPESAAVSASPFEALALLVFKFAVAAALLAAAAAVARRRSYRCH